MFRALRLFVSPTGLPSPLPHTPFPEFLTDRGTSSVWTAYRKGAHSPGGVCMMKAPALVAAFLVALVLAGNPAGAAPAPPPVPAPGGAPPTFPGQTIVVTGRGVAEATPDRGLVNIGA